MAWLQAVKEPSGPHDVTFPPLSAGARVLGPLTRAPEAIAADEALKERRAAAFDGFYQCTPARSGRKQLKRLLKGPAVMDYYMDAHDDPQWVNVEGQQTAAERAARNARGYKRRRPAKKAAKGGDKGGGARRR